MSRLLIVASDLFYIAMMERYLAWYGFEVDHELDSSAAIKRLERGAYDLLVGGLVMVPVEATSLFREIRAHELPSLRNLPIMATGPEEPTVEEFELLYNLKVGYISKYRSVEVFMERIRTLMRKEVAP